LVNRVPSLSNSHIGRFDNCLVFYCVWQQLKLHMPHTWHQ